MRRITKERKTAYVALGANLGEPARILMRAADRMDAVIEGARVAARSRIWHTAPHELSALERPQPRFLRERAGGLAESGTAWYANMAVRLECTVALTPETLFESLMTLEKELGRNRLFEKRYGSRCIDIDLLLFDDAVRKSAYLTLPHPRMLQREFVLNPLREIIDERSLVFLGMSEERSGASFPNLIF